MEAARLVLPKYVFAIIKSPMQDYKSILLNRLQTKGVQAL